MSIILPPTLVSGPPRQKPLQLTWTYPGTGNTISFQPLLSIAFIKCLLMPLHK